jgi:predicted membrane-bound dolichyl-phosphate-mannose-protein mannosyltransferase
MGWLASSLSGGNQRVIAAAAILLSTSPTWFLLSSVGMLDSVELFFGLLALAVYFSKFGKEKTRLLASGMLMGLSILSKEEGVLLLAGLLAYELIFGRPKRAFYVFASSFITVLAVLWAYDSLYTPFVNPLQHIQFIIDTGFRLRYQAGFLASPIEWFYQSREILLAVLSLIWLPLAIFTVYRWRRDTLRLPALSASLLLMSPLPLVLLYYVDHRQEYLFYELQLIPVLVLGASWLLSSLRIPRLVLTITLIVAVLLFALALPTLQSIYINTQWRI